MHIDLNSCFAAIEQQANPKLRGVPTVVAAYPTGGGCILAASIEAKEFGIKTGWRVREAKTVCPRVVVLTPDPQKYRHVHREMMKIFETYCSEVIPKSIDEAVLIFNNRQPYVSPQSKVPKRQYGPAGSLSAAAVPKPPQTAAVLTLDRGLTNNDSLSGPLGVTGDSNLKFIGQQIKKDVKERLGEWLTVSIGLGSNRFLAKTAAGLKKPDGLEEINYSNAVQIFKTLRVEDLCGINVALKSRLNAGKIYSAFDFLQADLPTLKSIFKSICAYHWYMRLRGFEVDAWKSNRQSVGHSYALPRATNNEKELGKILFRLCEKVGTRLRGNNLEAQGIAVSCSYNDHTYFHKSRKLASKIFTTPEIYQQSLRILSHGVTKPVSLLAVTAFSLTQSLYQQQTLFENQNKKRLLAQALDEVNNKYGNFSVTFGNTLGLSQKILGRIAFGGIRDMEIIGS
jgi:DNA polymerase-4